MKLKESIPTNSFKIIDLYNKIDAGLLDTSPKFQRKLVWKKQHKYSFIQTILLNYPFPEVYIASAEMDVQNLKSLEIVVDGQQRLTTIVDYIKGVNDFADQNKVTAFDDLALEAKKEFLNYSVTVKDLKDIGMENIKEIFKRINSTDYSLNSNEIINAQFGDGEFAIFSKQLSDLEFNITEENTDILIPFEKREFITSFFKANNVFSDNDVKRMFDSQYIMLLSSTILEGKYFGRSSRINHYLEKYNLEFLDYNIILDKLIKSIKLINDLKLSEGSYWFNKSNLFSLIIELSKVDTSTLNHEDLERLLSDLENKVDIYFNGDEEEIKLLSQDETKFFEVSRQGSHEFSAREHRGKVISSILKKSSVIDNEPAAPAVAVEIKNINALIVRRISFSKLIPTETGLAKSIMDATSTVREFLKEENLHNYSTQELGPTHKVKMESQFILQNFDKKQTEVSLYRSNGRGDYRIWFKELGTFVSANEELALIVIENKINVLNISKYDYTDYINTL